MSAVSYTMCFQCSLLKHTRVSSNKVNFRGSRPPAIQCKMCLTNITNIFDLARMCKTIQQ